MVAFRASSPVFCAFCAVHLLLRLHCLLLLLVCFGFSFFLLIVCCLVLCCWFAVFCIVCCLVVVFVACLVGCLFVCLLLLVVVLLLLCMMEVTLGFRLKNSSLQQLLCVKPLLQGRFRILDISSASQKLWPSNRQTCWFLVWYGLLVMFYCAAGHQWKSSNSNSEKENLFLHCTERIPNPDHHSDDEDGRGSQKKVCNKKLTWRRPSTLPNYVANNFLPAQYLASLYWFASESLQNGSQTSRRKYQELVWLSWTCQKYLVAFCCSFGFFAAWRRRENRLFGRNFSHEKNCKGGFRGCATAGTKKSCLGCLNWI